MLTGARQPGLVGAMVSVAPAFISKVIQVIPYLIVTYRGLNNGSSAGET